MASNNTTLLESCFAEFKTKHLPNLLDNGEAFEIFCVTQLTKESNLDLQDIENSIVDGGQDGGIDSFIVLGNGQHIETLEEVDDISFNENSSLEVLITQAKSEKTLTEDPFDKLNISLPIIFDLEKNENDLFKRFNNDLVEKILIFRKTWRNAAINKSKIVITLSIFHQANSLHTNKQIDSKHQQILGLVSQSMVGANVTFNLYSAEEILKLYSSRRTTKLILKFKEPPIAVKFKDSEQGFIGIIALNDYYNFITDEKRRLREPIFESNVRHFQGDVDVNKKIAESIEQDHSRDFWWLNNGITIIASDCGIMPKELSLENARIVNGLQTSFIINKHLPANAVADDRSILVKVIISKNDETIDKIISATNSQTAVPPTLLKATDDLQRNLELFFLSKDYFYDRRKNYYKNLNKPSFKIFNIQETAQAIESIVFFNPATARAKPTTLIKDTASYTRIFNPATNFQAYLNCCLLTRKSSAFVKNLPRNDKTQIRNFIFHLARITASLSLKKFKYGPEEISQLNISSIDDATLTTSISILKSAIQKYLSNNPTENIINIAKSIKFIKTLDSDLFIFFSKQPQSVDPKEI
ncbi:MAG: AIPR family protein [Desulfobulbaceae bacterium]|nr:AIPR family protein [Desulfobulbaceae bacterium]